MSKKYKKSITKIKKHERRIDKVRVEKLPVPEEEKDMSAGQAAEFAAASGTQEKTAWGQSSKSGWGKPKTDAEKQSNWGANELDIVMQTEDYVIVNKPSGLASQPGSGTRPGESLVEYLWE